MKQVRKQFSQSPPNETRVGVKIETILLKSLSYSFGRAAAMRSISMGSIVDAAAGSKSASNSFSLVGDTGSPSSSPSANKSRDGGGEQGGVTSSVSGEYGVEVISGGTAAVGVPGSTALSAVVGRAVAAIRSARAAFQTARRSTLRCERREFGSRGIVG